MKGAVNDHKNVFFPLRIAICPECDSDNIRIVKRRGGKKKDRPSGIEWWCGDCGCAGTQSGCTIVVAKAGRKP